LGDPTNDVQLNADGLRFTPSGMHRLQAQVDGSRAGTSVVDELEVETWLN
jgi:hypothetical protein